MTSNAPQPADQPSTPRFQFSLRTLLLLCVVLASSLAVFGIFGIGMFGLTVALAIYLQWPGTRPLLTFVVIVLLILFALLLPAVDTRWSGRRAQCFNNMRQIVLALLSYEAANGCFPPAYIADKSGKPMHSWRVLILPYMDETPLYKSYNFNEPWDGPNNKKLLASRPSVYACASDDAAFGPGSTHTSYVAVVGKNAAWEGEKPRKIGFPGAASKTVMVVEVANSGVAWTEPRDLLLDAIGTSAGESSGLSVSSCHKRDNSFFFIYERKAGANVAFADGHVQFLPPGGLATENLRNVLEIGGCRLDEPDFEASLQGKEHWRFNWPNIGALGVWLVSTGALLIGAVRTRKTPASRPAEVIVERNTGGGGMMA